MELEFHPDVDYNADIATYKRSRERILKSDMEPTRKAALIANCDYAIAWLETGRRPGNKRGVERLAAYQREIPIELMDKYAAPAEPCRIQTHILRYQELLHMEYILSMLTDRERECYEMHVGGQRSTREIGELLGINHKTVHENIKRAENKIKQYKKRPMPTLLDIVV